MKGKVYVKIPTSGLGNCMLVWAHGLVFARMNNLELVTGRWWRFRWGAIFRREKKTRLYKGYFIETPWRKLFNLKLSMLFLSKEFDPEMKGIKNPKNPIFIFTKTSPEGYLFRSLYPFLDRIREELYEMLTPRVKEKLKDCKAPVIGIHIRRGDFKIGNPITPNRYFIEAINAIRKAFREDLPVTVFTDAKENEISDILKLQNISLSCNKEDVLDILQMSKSKFLVLSQSSTFSYWAAFLSDGFVIMSSEDWQERIKPSEGTYTEFRYSENQNTEELKKLLKQNV